MVFRFGDAEIFVCIFDVFDIFAAEQIEPVDREPMVRTPDIALYDLR